MLVTKTCLARIKGPKNLTVTLENQTNLISSEPLALGVNEAEGENAVLMLSGYCSLYIVIVCHLQYLPHSISNPQ